MRQAKERAEAAALLESEPSSRALAGRSLFIGPLTTIHKLERSPEVRNALREPAIILAAPAVANATRPAAGVRVISLPIRPPQAPEGVSSSKRTP